MAGEIGSSWGCVEGVDFGDVDFGLGEVGVFEDGGCFGACAFGASWGGRGLLGFSFEFLHAPFWREGFFTGREFGETLAVVLIPEVELEVFGGVLDVDEVVHEVSGCAWLLEEVLVWIYWSWCKRLK